jgi:hypothetical protein
MSEEEFRQFEAIANIIIIALNREHFGIIPVFEFCELKDGTISLSKGQSVRKDMNTNKRASRDLIIDIGRKDICKT